MTDHARAREALAEIEAGLEGVTPGPWTMEWSMLCGNGGKTIGVKALGLAHFSGPRCGDEESRNADHIARCDPSNMAAIVALVKAQDAEIARLRDQIGQDASLLEVVAEEMNDRGDVIWSMCSVMVERARTTLETSHEDH